MTCVGTRCLFGTVLGLGLCLANSWDARATSILQNGSFEDPGNVWTNTSLGFMSLPAGSTVIPGWTVANDVVAPIAWGRSPDFPFPAADGSYYVDLLGLASNSTNGAITQTISVTPGTSYTLDLGWATISNVNVRVSVDGVDVPLLTPFGNGLYWTVMEGTFTAGANPNPVLTIGRAPVGQNSETILLVDAITMAVTTIPPTGPPTSAPEPATITLFGVALAALGIARRRRG